MRKTCGKMYGNVGKCGKMCGKCGKMYEHLEKAGKSGKKWKMRKKVASVGSLLRLDLKSPDTSLRLPLHGTLADPPPDPLHRVAQGPSSFKRSPNSAFNDQCFRNFA